MLPFSLVLVVCSTIQKWLSAGSAKQHVLLLADGGGGDDILAFIAAASYLYNGAFSSEVKVKLGKLSNFACVGSCLTVASLSPHILYPGTFHSASANGSPRDVQ